MNLKLNNQVKKHLEKADVDFKDNEECFTFFVKSKIGSVVMCIDIDEVERCLFIQALTMLDIESKNLSKHYELTNKINQDLSASLLNVDEEHELIGAYVNLLFINELDEEALEKAIGLCSDTLASFFPAYMMINASEVSVSEAIAVVNGNIGEA